MVPSVVASFASLRGAASVCLANPGVHIAIGAGPLNGGYPLPCSFVNGCNAVLDPPIKAAGRAWVSFWEVNLINNYSSSRV